MPRKHYFILDSSRFFDLAEEPPAGMNNSEMKRYAEAMMFFKTNKPEKSKRAVNILSEFHKTDPTKINH